MTELHVCADGGWLVNSLSPVPDDLSDYWHQGGGVTVGCNRLQCWLCKTWVRSVPDVYVSELEDHAAELHATADWSTLPYVQSSARSRTYVCACTGWFEYAVHLVQDPDRDDPGAPDLPWRCAGHPLASLPFDVDGVAVTAGTDFDGLVRQSMAGWTPPQARTQHQAFPAEWLCRLYARLDGLPQASHLANAVAAHLRDDDDAGVGAALLFYHRFPLAPGNEGVDVLADQDDGHAASRAFHVPYGDRSFSYSPLGALVRRLDLLDAAEAVETDAEAIRRTLSRVQRGLLQPRAGSGVDALRAVARHAPRWLADRAVELVRAQPEVMHPLLDVLATRHETELVVVAGTAMATAPGLDSAELRRWIDRGDHARSSYAFALRHVLDKTV